MAAVALPSGLPRRKPMTLTVRPIKPTRSELKKYVHTGIDLYKDAPCYVPPLVIDEMATLSPKSNPAFDHCEAQSFIAERDGKAVGRITAIINHNANRKFGSRDMRFGFVDFIDDAEVVDALFDAASAWGRQRGMDSIVGPMGFSDMDHEGMLIEGFDEMGTMATIYNYPYYRDHMERLGFVKDADWIEFRIKIPSDIPDKYARIADIVSKKYGLHTVPLTSRKEVKKKYGRPLFDLINEAYKDLYGYTSLTPRQIDYYVDQYLDIIRLDCVSAVADAEGNLVAVGISMPSLSEALRRSHGRLLPMGWWHLLKALRAKTDTVDLMLVAVKPEYQSKGVNALVFCDLIRTYNRLGFKYAESNIELEDNENVQRQWDYFEHRQHRRRRAWRKSL